MTRILVNNKPVDYFMLNWLRGLASVFVLLGHMRSLGWARDQDLSYWKSGWEKILLIPTSFAVESVAVFFVISGFLVGGKLVTKSRTHDINFPEFFIDRITRLHTVLIPGLIFSFFLFELKGNLVNSLKLSQVDIVTFSCNILFLMPQK